MARTTVALVRGVIDTSLTDPQVETQIEIASAIVDDAALCINKDEARLTLIETQLAAHYIALLPGQNQGSVTKQKDGKLETEYAAASVEKSIDATSYGQQANQLAGGCLSDIGKKKAEVCFL